MVASSHVVGAEVDMWAAPSWKPREKSNGSGLNSGVGSDSEGTLRGGVGSFSGWLIAVGAGGGGASDADVGVLVSFRGLCGESA